MKPRDADLKKEFEAIDTENNKNLDFPEFLSLYDTLAFRPEIQVIFKEHATGSETTLMTMDDFRRFLVSEQGVSTFSLDSIPRSIPHPCASFSFSSLSGPPGFQSTRCGNL